MRPHRWLTVWGVLALACLLVQPARAIIVYGDQGQNLTPAPSDLDRYVGDFGNFLGTPIGPRHFVTARHIGNAGSNVFTFTNGTGSAQSFQVVQDPISSAMASVLGDIAIWKIADDSAPGFDVVAPLYTGGNEVGLSMTLIGRGPSRGDAYLNADGDEVGWLWGSTPSSRPRSWGTNQVDSVVGATYDYGGLTFENDRGEMLLFDFDSDQGPNEGMYSNGDSGGAAFVLDPTDGQWKLAGLAYAVLSPFANEPGGPYRNAAIHDARGLYIGNPDNNAQLLGDEPIGTFGLASRIATADRLNVLRPLAVPEPGSWVLVAIGCVGVLARRRIGCPSQSR